MTLTTDDSDRIEHLAEEYLELLRCGESILIEEYCARHPKHADELRSILPALAVLEGFRPAWHEAIDEASSDGVAFPEIAGYRIIGQIGKGGMGVVYEAEQESLGRRVAIKVVPRVGLSGSHATQRFQREARAAAKMHHTNIVPVFEIGENDDNLYYAMQLINGQSLDHVIEDLRRQRRDSVDGKSGPENEPSPEKNDSIDRITRSLMRGRFKLDNSTGNTANVPSAETSGTIPVSNDSGLTSSTISGGRFFDSVARLGLQVAEALSYSHARGIIHRDIKPGNLILDSSGVVWVTDFGLAKVEEQDNLTRTGDIVGTVRYMSPERFSGQCDERSDIYALGLTLYEMLVLQAAFIGSTRASLISSILHVDPPSTRRVDQRIPRDLDTIILRAMEKDPRLRYSSSAEFGDDLRRFIRHEPVLARRVSPVERFWRWSRRNPALSSSMAIATLLLVVMTVGSLFVADRFRGEKRIQSELTIKYQEEARRANDARQESENRGEELARRGETLCQNLYVSQMNEAGSIIRAPGNFYRVRSLLQPWPPCYRYETLAVLAAVSLEI